MNNFLKYSLIGLPILVGGYIIYRQIKPKKKKGATPPPAPAPTTTYTPAPSGGGTRGGGTSGGSSFQVRDAFPLKKGSKGAKVTELQNAIIASGNADAIKELGSRGADGDFGGGTEKAVKILLGKTQVDNQQEIENIKNIVKKIEGTTNRIAIAKKLVDTFKSKSNPAFYALWDTEVETNKLTSDGRLYDKKITVIGKGRYLVIPKNAVLTIDSGGFITAKTATDYWWFSPYGFDVK